MNNQGKNNDTNNKKTINNTQGIISSNNNRELKPQGNLGNLEEIIDTKLSIDSKRATPQEVQEINTSNKWTTKFLKHALSNAYRHGLSLRAGILNAANGNCLFDAIIANILGRGCYKKKLKENSKQLRIRSITEAQFEKHKLTFL